MLNRLNNKTKFILLVLFSFLFAIFTYKIAVKKTLLVKREVKQLKQKREILSFAPKEIALLKKQQMYYDSIIQQNLTYSKNPQKIILEQTSIDCRKRGVLLLEIPEMKIYHDKGVTIYLSKVTSQGSFSQLLRLLYDLEKEQKIGNILSVLFETEQNNKTRQRYLKMTLLVQNVISKE